MPLPALPSSPSLTWLHNQNNIIAAGSGALDNNRSLLRGIKNALIGFATEPLTVVGSSNSAAAALDGVDRWTTNSNLVWANAGTAHSWIVLKSTQLTSNFQILFSCEGSNANGQYLYLSFSPNNGFTGGTTLNRPSATDENVLIAGGTTTWSIGNISSDIQVVWNVSKANTDGSIRIFAFYNAVNIIFAYFNKLSPVAAGVTYPVDACWQGGTTTVNQGTITILNATNGRCRPVAANINTSCSCLGANGVANPTSQVAVSPYSTKWPAYEMWSWDATNNCILGMHQDMYFGSTTQVNAAAYPSTGTNIWGTVGKVILPTGGNVLTTS